MKKLLKIFGIILLILVAIIIYFKFFINRLLPPKRINISRENPKIAIEQVTLRLNVDKYQLKINNKKLSGIDWKNYNDKNMNFSDKLKYLNIFAYINDYTIANVNEYIVGQELSLDYLLSAGIKLKKFNDKGGAKHDIDEFEKILDEHKCVKNYQNLKDMIKYFRKKNHL